MKPKPNDLVKARWRPGHVIIGRVVAVQYNGIKFSVEHPRGSHMSPRELRGVGYTPCTDKITCSSPVPEYDILHIYKETPDEV